MPDRSDIDEVLARTDIVSVVEQYVSLKRAGRNFKGLCPFHQEKTPSFQVSPEMGRWHCFGQCGEGGDALKFVQKIENLSFPEALERLALRAGVSLMSRRPRGSAAGELGGTATSEAAERSKLYQINSLALGFYRDLLSRTADAQEYLSGRSVGHDTQVAFAVGFAPDAWDGLVGFLTRKGIALADAERAGLVGQGDRGGYYDKLRGRLIFPILDAQERPIAFGGRLIGEGKPGQPKYWNSPETPIFSKSRTLYGLWRARKAISAAGCSVIVEGYTDVIAAHQAGFENVVATLGTSLTEEHVKILAPLAPTVMLAFDADSAGLKAAFRAAEMFEAQDVEVRVLDLPEGEDPDSLLRHGKRAVFQAAMENALPLVEYRIKSLIRRGPTETDADRVALFRKALPVLAAVHSTIEREQYVKMLAPYHPQYRVGAVYAEDQIRQDVAGYGRSQGQRTEYSPPPRPATTLQMPGGAAEQAERHLLRALMSDDTAIAGRVLAQIAPSEFYTETGRALAHEIYSHYRESPSVSPSQLLAALPDAGMQDMLTALLMGPNQEPLAEHLIDGEVAHLKLRPKELQRTQLKAKIEQGQASMEECQQYARLSSELRGSRIPQNS